MIFFLANARLRAFYTFLFYLYSPVLTCLRLVESVDCTEAGQKPPASAPASDFHRPRKTPTTNRRHPQPTETTSSLPAIEPTPHFAGYSVDSSEAQ